MSMPPFRNATPALATILALTLFAGCTSRPELDQAARPPAGPTPALLPIDALIAQTGADATSGDPAGDLKARAARLKARAHALQGGAPAAGT